MKDSAISGRPVLNVGNEDEPPRSAIFSIALRLHEIILYSA